MQRLMSDPVSYGPSFLVYLLVSPENQPTQGPPLNNWFAIFQSETTEIPKLLGGSPVEKRKRSFQVASLREFWSPFQGQRSFQVASLWTKCVLVPFSRAICSSLDQPPAFPPSGFDMLSCGARGCTGRFDGRPKATRSSQPQIGTGGEALRSRKID